MFHHRSAIDHPQIAEVAQKLLPTMAEEMLAAEGKVKKLPATNVALALFDFLVAICNVRGHSEGFYCFSTLIADFQQVIFACMSSEMGLIVKFHGAIWTLDGPGFVFGALMVLQPLRCGVGFVTFGTKRVR